MITADYARVLVLKNTGEQLKRMDKIIRNACNEGKYEIIIDWNLCPQVKSILKENGFHLKEKFYYGKSEEPSFVSVTVSWRADND